MRMAYVMHGKISAFYYWTRRRLRWIVLSACSLGLLISAAPIYAVLASRGEVYTVSSVPAHDVALVFGAGISKGVPTPYLASRLRTAIQLYKQGRVRVLLMSGDNSTARYDEPSAMKKYVVTHGVPASAVVLDYAGFDTYDTCYRARDIFGVKSAVLVSHGYHLPRALLTCNALGVKSVGVSASQPSSSYSKSYLAREVLSLNKAVVQMVLRMKPKILGPKENTVTAALAVWPLTARLPETELIPVGVLDNKLPITPWPIARFSIWPDAFIR